jgi:subtilisin-like proprotein convertase family protein
MRHPLRNLSIVSTGVAARSLHCRSAPQTSHRKQGRFSLSLAKLTLVAACLMLVLAGIASATVFANTTPIAINSSTTPQVASPYPSLISVSGLTGSITDVNVTLHNLSHTFPGDIDILLVGPGGQKVILMSDAGGDPDAVNANITLDQQAANPLPPDPAGLPSGTYRPMDYPEDPDGCQLPDTYPSPAPAGPYGSSLNVFNGLAGSSMNGVWSLYVVDECQGFSGQIAGGWSLDILTTPPTAVQSRSFDAEPSRAGTVLRWRTASESELLGFNLYRTQRGRLVKLNRTLIASVFSGTTGHSYSWLDRSAASGAARYRLQAVSLSGRKSWVGSAAVAR